MIHKNFNRFTLLLSLSVISVVLTACNLPRAEVADEQAVDSLPNDQPFDQASPAEFFELCESQGGQVEQWGDGWACDFEEDEDITCDAAGDCTYGTVEKPSEPGYKVKKPVLAAEDDPGDFVAACQDAGGAFIEWHAGFGCDFEDQMDVFCVPEEGGECGLGWVTELTKLIHEEEVPRAGLVLVAPLFQPAFITDTAAGDEPPTGFAVSKEVILDGFQQGRPQTDSDGNEVAQADDTDSGGDDVDFGELAEICELSGGHAVMVGSADGDRYLICQHPDGDIICDKWGCYSSPILDDIVGDLDFGNFQEAFLATEVFIVLAGPSNLARDFREGDEPGPDLYTAILETYGYTPIPGQPIPIPYPNLPGTVSIVAPNNIFEPPIDPAVLLLKPNLSGDPMSTKECGILRPPLCYPDLPLNGLMIPEMNLVYYVEVGDLPMPDQFNWVEKLEPTPKGPVFKASVSPLTPAVKVSVTPAVKVSVTPVTPVFKASVTPSPTVKNTKKAPNPTALPPSLTPIPPDPMNASISGKAFKDANNDGVFNGSDVGYGSVTIRLGSGSCNSTNLGSQITSGSGNFSFTGLAAGTYCVSVDLSSLGTYNIANTPTKYTVVVGAGGSVNKMFGFGKPID